MKIYEEIGEAAMLEQLAEECTELAQAALKLARLERGENPVRSTKEECTAHVLEEIADVECSLSQLTHAPWMDTEEVFILSDKKTERWIKSLEEHKAGQEAKRGYQI